MLSWGGDGKGQKTYQIRLPQTLAHAKQLLRRRARHDKVLCKVDAANAVEAADEGLSRLGVQAADNGRDKVRAEAALVEGGGDEVGKGARGDGALLAQAVHVDLVAEEVADGADVGGQAGQAQEDVAVLEDFGEVVGDGQGLEAEAEIAGDGDAVLADHGDAGTAVWGELAGKFDVG
jgi:hypothetical protein